MPETARLTIEEADNLARTAYGDTPEAHAILRAYVDSTDPVRRLRLFRALAWIDPANDQEPGVDLSEEAQEGVQRVAAGPGLDPDDPGDVRDAEAVGGIQRVPDAHQILVRQLARDHLDQIAPLPSALRSEV